MENAYSWIKDYLAAWRALAREAPPQRLAGAIAETADLRGPTSATVVAAVVGGRIAAFLVELEPGEESCIGLPLDSLPAEDDEQGLVKWLRMLDRRARTNWSPGRPKDPPFGPWSPSLATIDGKFTMVVATAPDSLCPQRLAEYHFREQARPNAVPSNLSNAAVEYLFAMNSKREDHSLERWLFGHAHQLLAFSGLQRGWWCVVNPPRKDLFGDGQGDVDLVAGPLELALDATEQRARYLKAAAAYPLTHPPETIQAAWIERAVQEGLLVWPPRMDYLVAWEAKASAFVNDTLKSSHVNSGPKLLGQLGVCLKRGFDRVGYLHFVATAPVSPLLGNPHLSASRRIASAFERLPLIERVWAQERIGYVQVAMGAVPNHPEHFEGVGGTHWRRAPDVNPLADRNAVWRKRLQERFAALPPPATLCAFFATCSSCGGWYPSPMPRRGCPRCVMT